MRELLRVLSESRASVSVGWLVIVLAAGLFATTLTEFRLHVTDIGALQVLAGRVPYRDFWTMYAPGSLYATAGAFALFGREAIVSNALGLLAATASVALFHRVACAVSRSVLAPACAALVTAAVFFGEGYHHGLTSYPIAIAFVWLAVERLVAFAARARAGALVACGLALGAAIVCKHDVGGYVALAVAATLVLLPLPGRPLARRLRDVATVASSALVVVLPVVAALLGAGAGADAFADLVDFPRGPFRFVRTETWPWLPIFFKNPVTLLLANRQLAMVQAPLVVAVPATVLLWRWRSALDQTTACAALFAVCAFPFFWTAGHIQLNTHSITLAALSSLLATACTKCVGSPGPRRRLDRLALALAGLGVLVALSRPAVDTAAQRSGETGWIDLPGLWGLRASREEAIWMRGLAHAIGEAAPPDAPLLFVGRRNDVLVHARNIPAWLSQRRLATRYPELHPAVTDTELVQREMIADAERGLAPVVVREDRLGDAHLDRAKAAYLRHVAVGATQLDAWIDARYGPSRCFNLYEVMQRR